MLGGGDSRRRATRSEPVPVTPWAWPTWARWRPAGLAWALLLLVLLGLAATAWLDRLLRQASLPELTWLNLSSIPQVVAAVSAATVGAGLAARPPRHSGGWPLLRPGPSLTGG